MRRYHRDVNMAELFGEARMLNKAITYQTQDLSNQDRLWILKTNGTTLEMRKLMGNQGWEKYLDEK